MAAVEQPARKCQSDVEYREAQRNNRHGNEYLVRRTGGGADRKCANHETEHIRPGVADVRGRRRQVPWQVAQPGARERDEQQRDRRVR